MPNDTNFSEINMILKCYHRLLLAALIVFLFVPAAWGGGGGFWLYEVGNPGSGHCRRRADGYSLGLRNSRMNPARMTRLDRSNAGVRAGALYQCPV